MRGAPILAAARILLGLGAGEAYLFNRCRGVWRVELATLDDYKELTEQPDCETPLVDSIAWMLKHEVARDEALVVITDEQENASRESADRIAGLARGRPVIIVNVAPYPTDHVPKQPRDNIVGLPGTTPEAVIAGATLVGIGLLKRQTAGKPSEELLEAVRSALESLKDTGLLA